MRNVHSSLRALAWTAITISSVQAQHIIDELSFGHKPDSIRPEGRSITGWSLLGEQYIPELLSDRVILTPPYPGNKRGALWSEASLPAAEWEADLYFRASGQERGGGNLQLWYARDGVHEVGTSSLYTVDKFDGLVLVVDQYGGRGGTIRGFLNDGSRGFHSSANVDTLSFGQCDYPYRNQGRFSVLTLKQTVNDFEVLIDKRPCFKSNKVLLPPRYNFGITAASPENPDSFEIHQFSVTSPFAQPDSNAHQQQMLYNFHERQKAENNAAGNAAGNVPQQGNDHQQGNAAPIPAAGQIPTSMPDVLAETIKDQQQQFADLHNRLQLLSHQYDNMFRELGELNQRLQDRHEDIMNRLRPAHDNSLNIIQTLNKIDRTIGDLKREVEGKDYREHISQLRNAVTQSQSTIMENLPKHMTNIVSDSSPKLSTLVFVIAAIQVVVLGAYIAYKKRRDGMPKKYL